MIIRIRQGSAFHHFKANFFPLRRVSTLGFSGKSQRPPTTATKSTNNSSSTSKDSSKNDTSSNTSKNCIVNNNDKPSGT